MGEGSLSCTTKGQSQLCAKMVQSWVSQQRDKCPLRNLVLQWCHGSFAAAFGPLTREGGRCRA